MAAEVKERSTGSGQNNDVNPWLIAITVTLATFMELLDTAIANVSLPHIAGGLATSYDESTWVLTSYLVANAVVLPLSAWLSRVFGRKNYYMTCVALFSISSLLCGFAPSLGLLIFFRVHGTQKLFGWCGGPGLDTTGQFFAMLGFPPGRRHALVAGLGETGGGLLLAFGLFTPLAAALLCSVMLVATVNVHIKKGFFAQNGGYEYPLVLGVAALTVALPVQGRCHSTFCSDIT